MSMDRTTEIIAHFIGDFALSVEIGRIRADYEKIRTDPEADPALAALKFEGLLLAPDHTLEDLDPQIVYQPLPPTPFAIPFIPPAPDLRPGPDHVIEVAPPEVPQVTVFLSVGDIRIDTVLGLDMLPPASIAAVLQMSNQLQDADVFGVSPAAFLAPAIELAQILQVMGEQIMALSPLPAALETLSGSPAGALDWAGLTAQITQAAEQISQMPLGGTVLQGDATFGVHIDGATADALPDWQDLLPTFLREEDETDGSDSAMLAQGDAEDGEEETQDANATSEQETQGPTEGSGPPSGMTVIQTDAKAAFGKAMTGLADKDATPAEPAQAPFVVTGANQLVNEAAITSNWLDASVIVVEGDARELTAISQVSATFDRDTAPGMEASATPGGQPSSMVMNAASITASANPAARDADQAETQPSGFAIARITGDLVQVNGVQQYNFASDTDSLLIDIPSSRLQLSAGENALTNLAVLNEFGWTFDLIVVGGNMIDATMIRQMNLLVDDDIVTPIQDLTSLDAPPPVTAGAGGMGPGVPREAIQEETTVTSETSETTKTIETTETSETTEATATRETATGSPATSAPVSTAPAASAPALASAQTQAATEGTGQTLVSAAASAPAETTHAVSTAPQAATPIAASTTVSQVPAADASAAASGDTSQDPAPSTDASAATAAPANLSYNEARIHTEGLNVAAELPEALAKASKALAEGAEALGREVLGLDLFEGVDLLKVLLIEGDFTTVNWIDQINVLGDQDRVEMLKEAIAALPDAQLVTEANLLANLASITKQGIDSQIMAKGESYSDALLHQAGFVEEGAPATGAGLTELASEAVAFLADGMIETATAELEAGQAALDSGLAALSASQADLMQTMLS